MTFLDTNVFIYAAGRDSEYKASCVRVLADVVRGVSTDAHFDLLDNLERIDPRSYPAGG